MTKFIFIPIIFVMSFVAQMFLPWWTMVIICFAVCYLLVPLRWMGFVGSLLAIFVLWYVKAFIADGHFDVPMSTILGGVMGNISSSAVLFLTGIVGGLAGGLGGLIGSWSRMFPTKVESDL